MAAQSSSCLPLRTVLMNKTWQMLSSQGRRKKMLLFSPSQPQHGITYIQLLQAVGLRMREKRPAHIALPLVSFAIWHLYTKVI